jgi:hypothetical protein
MTWASSRKVIYAILFIVMLVAFGVYGFRGILFPTPTCVDDKQNGYEEGVDCGGMCARKCIDQISPLRVVWTRVIPVDKEVYDLAALISNRNLDSAPFTLSAVFTVYDKKAKVIFTRRVSITPPTTGDIPIILQNISFKEEPHNLVVTLEEGTSYKTPLAFQSVQISATNYRFENGDIPRLYVTIKNLTRERFINLPVRLVLYDSDQNAIGVGQTIIESLDKDSSDEVVFTWNTKFKVAPTVIKAYPILSPFD